MCQRKRPNRKKSPRKCPNLATRALWVLHSERVCFLEAPKHTQRVSGRGGKSRTCSEVHPQAPHDQPHKTANPAANRSTHNPPQSVRRPSVSEPPAAPMPPAFSDWPTLTEPGGVSRGATNGGEKKGGGQRQGGCSGLAAPNAKCVHAIHMGGMSLARAAVNSWDVPSPCWGCGAPTSRAPMRPTASGVLQSTHRRGLCM